MRVLKRKCDTSTSKLPFSKTTETTVNLRIPNAPLDDTGAFDVQKACWDSQQSRGVYL